MSPGAIDVDIAFRKMPKPEGWEHDSAFTCELRKKSLATGIEWLTQITQSSQNAPPGFQAADFIQARSALAQLAGIPGKNGARRSSNGKPATRWRRPTLPECCPNWRNHSASPTSTKRRWKTTPTPNRVTAACFLQSVPRPTKRLSTWRSPSSTRLKYLEKKPEDLEVKWLLNLDYMVLGKYPAGVPAKYLTSSCGVCLKRRHRPVRGCRARSRTDPRSRWPAE